MDKKFENRHWELEEYNGMIVGKLYFTQYYDENMILGFQQDKEDKELFWYVSDFLNVEQDCIAMESPNTAMEEFENMIIEHIEDEISSLEDLKDKFNEEKVCW
jgi:hypothetical protein